MNSSNKRWMRNKKMAVPYDARRAKLSELELILQRMYWYNLFEHSRFFYNLTIKFENVSEKWAELKSKTNNLSVRFQMAFWAFISRQAKQLIESDSSMFYEVISQTTPNPLSSPEMVQLAGAGAIVMRSIRLLLIPLQKLLQYAYWKTAPPGSNAKKPELTRKDMLYLGLDIVLLALTIAALASGAAIPAAAIAFTAAVIAGTVAAVQYGKFLYDGYQMKKEKRQVDALLVKIKNDPSTLLNEHELKLLNDQRDKLGDITNKDNLTPAQVLEMRSAKLETDINKNIADKYALTRKTLSTALTVMGIVAAGLILGGLLLGPFGFPVVAAGVALSITACAIAVGMMIANYVKKGRDNAQAAIGKKDVNYTPVAAEIDDNNPDLTKQHIRANDSVYAVTPAIKSGAAIDKSTAIQLPALPPASTEVSTVSIFSKSTTTQPPLNDKQFTDSESKKNTK